MRKGGSRPVRTVKFAHPPCCTLNAILHYQAFCRLALSDSIKVDFNVQPLGFALVQVLLVCILGQEWTAVDEQRTNPEQMARHMLIELSAASREHSFAINSPRMR